MTVLWKLKDIILPLKKRTGKPVPLVLCWNSGSNANTWYLGFFFFFYLPSVYVSKNCFISSLNPVDIITYKCKHSCSFSVCCQISSLCDILKCHRNAQTLSLPLWAIALLSSEGCQLQLHHITALCHPSSDKKTTY